MFVHDVNIRKYFAFARWRGKRKGKTTVFTGAVPFAWAVKKGVAVTGGSPSCTCARRCLVDRFRAVVIIKR